MGDTKELKPGQSFDHGVPAILQRKADDTITEARAEIDAEVEAKAEAVRKAAAQAAYEAAARAEEAKALLERATHDTLLGTVAPPANPVPVPVPAPVVSVPDAPPAAATATPERRHANVEVLSISRFTMPGQARHFLVDVWKKYGPKTALAIVLGIAAFAVVVAVNFGRSYKSSRAGYSPETVVGLTHPTTNTPRVATAITLPTRAPMPRGLLPPPVPARTEPGLQGTRGSYVRMSARAAFPTSCATAGSPTSQLRGVRFFCGLHAGDNLCDCQVAGFVP